MNREDFRHQVKRRLIEAMLAKETPDKKAKIEFLRNIIKTIDKAEGETWRGEVKKIFGSAD